jgi:beta-galactosidase
MKAHIDTFLYCRFFGCRWLVLGLLLVGLPAAEAREDRLLSDGWHFQEGDVTSAMQPTYDDSAWQPVSLPHCWGWETAQVTNKYYRGPGWYRRPLAWQPQPGKRYFLRLEAAATVAEVYFNGQKLGEHRGGFGLVWSE